jgi:hypothetical protein
VPQQFEVKRFVLLHRRGDGDLVIGAYEITAIPVLRPA